MTASRRSPALLSLLTALALAAGALLAVPAAADGAPHDQVVGAVPGTNSPQVVDGRVYAITQVGGTTVIGGTFTQVQPHNRSQTYDRPYIVAFDSVSGSLNLSFLPQLDGHVEALAPGPTRGTVYAGGYFNTAAGVRSKGVVLLNLSDGSRVTSFRPAAMNGAVRGLRLVGPRLYVGGTFTTLNLEPHGGIAALDPLTGAVDPFIQSSVTENHNWYEGSTGARAAVGVFALDVTADGSRMVAIGNFRKVDGLDRRQVVMFDLTGTAAVVRPDWRARGYEAACAFRSYDTYMRDVDFDPQGRYFVIGTTGAGNTTLCDTVARFETAAVGDDVQPSWVNVTGGDTILSVSATGEAVYAGGHQRWMNNRLGNDFAGPGAVPRPGLAGLDTKNGVPLAWNPGRSPRGAGAYSLYATPAGLWVGSDTDWVGASYDYRRQKIAFFPLSSQGVHEDTVQALPAGLYTGAEQAGTATQLVRRTYSGSTTGAPEIVDSQVDWSALRGATLVGGSLFYGKSTDSTLYRRSFDGRTLGPEVLGDPYNDPVWSTVDTGSGSGSNTTFRGARPGFYAEIPNLTSMFYDGAGRLYYTLNGSSALFHRAFSPDSGIVHPVRQAVAGVSLPPVTGAFLSGDQLYYVTKSTGDLVRVGFDGRSLTGPAVVVSGPKTAGATVDWRAKVFFVGPSGPPNMPPSAQLDVSCTYLVCSYDASGSVDPDGSVASYAWDFGDGNTAATAGGSHAFAAGGSYLVRVTVTDDRGGTSTSGQQVTVAPRVNDVPTASAAVSCVHLVCTYDGSGSTDAEGPVADHAWDFGDGATSSAVAGSHTYQSLGTYTVSLTVTDGEGATSTTTQTVQVQPAPQSDVAFRAESGASGNVSTATVGVPASVRAGDALVLVVSTGTVVAHAPPAGWTEVVRTSGASATSVWQKVATGSDAGSSVPVVLGVPSGSVTKVDVRLLAYSGTAAVSPVSAVARADAAVTTQHVAPAAPVAVSGSWVVRYWSDKSSATTSWTAPAGVVVRSSAYGSGTGRVSALAGDEGAPAPSGTAAVSTGVTDAATRGTGVTIVLAPAT